MHIAIFDYKVIPTNPIGGRNLKMITSLCDEHDFTVFAVEFDNPNPERIKFVRIPAPTRPLAILFVAFHALAPIIFLIYQKLSKINFDLVLGVESNFYFVDVAISGFCHKAYLQAHGKNIEKTSLRGCLRWLNHRLHSLMEPKIYKNVVKVIVPSNGLKSELESVYPFLSERIKVIPNPVEISQFSPCEFSCREKKRTDLDFSSTDKVLSFVALGHFERKGLPLILQALSALENPQIKLLVVGGESDLINKYSLIVKKMKLKESVRFVGIQKSVQDYLCCSDAFILPSAYETFSQVTFQAAAAGLVVIVPNLYGVSEFLKDNVNGILITRTVDGIQEGIMRFLALSPDVKRQLTEQARRDVLQYDTNFYINSWREFFQGVECA